MPALDLARRMPVRGAPAPHTAKTHSAAVCLSNLALRQGQSIASNLGGACREQVNYPQIGLQEFQMRDLQASCKSLRRATPKKRPQARRTTFASDIFRMSKLICPANSPMPGPMAISKMNLARIRKLAGNESRNTVVTFS